MDVKIKKELAYRRIAGELFIVDSEKSRLHELNGPAAIIWEGLAREKSAQAVVSEIVSEFEIDAGTAAADMEEFVKELLKAGLLSDRPE